ncbi:MAG: hypothetical protein E4H27_00500 [Anaerolineales bacterium]|nr:MAG: hypothetical protein E4H27_00500 [Anaerolineales bacterium]
MTFRWPGVFCHQAASSLATRGYSLPLAPPATPGGTTRLSDPKVTAVPMLDGGFAVAVAVAGTGAVETGIRVGTPVAGTTVLVGRLFAAEAGAQAESRSNPVMRTVSTFGKDLDCVLVYINILLFLSDAIQ